MGSSAKKKKEKKKDFQKPKLKVGKAKPKASNFTDTSFKAKSIVLKKQYTSTGAPSSSAQFSHHVSLLRTKSDSQRFESLAYLTNAISSTPKGSPLPEPVSILLPHLQTLILDGSPTIRQQLLKILRALPSKDVARQPEQILLYTRAGMTHLSADIRSSSLDVLDWLLQAAGNEVVSCAGGWIKTLRCFETLLGWQQASAQGAWSSVQHATNKPGRDNKAAAKLLTSLAGLVRNGIEPPTNMEIEQTARQTVSVWPFWHARQHLLPERANAFAHLNLFGPPPDEDGLMLQDRLDRQQAFAKYFTASFQRGIDDTKKEGGEVGRASANLRKAIEDGMADYIA